MPAPAESGLSAARPRLKPRSKTQRIAAVAAAAAPKNQAADAAAAAPAPADQDLTGSTAVTRQPGPAAAGVACSAAEDLLGTAAAKQAEPATAGPEQAAAGPIQADDSISLAQQEPKPLNRRQLAKKRRAEKRERQLHKQAEEAGGCRAVRSSQTPAGLSDLCCICRCRHSRASVGCVVSLLWKALSAALTVNSSLDTIDQVCLTMKLLPCRGWCCAAGQRTKSGCSSCRGPG